VHFSNWTDLVLKEFEWKALFFGNSYSKNKTSVEMHMNKTLRKM